MNLPTWITFSRLLAVPALLVLLVPVPTPEQRLWAAVLFLVAAATDWLDGYLARRLGQVTDLGKFLDPLVDKLLVLAPLLMLVELGQIPGWGVFLILARELAVAGWRVNQTQISGANLWGKAKTVVQIVAVVFLILQWPYAVPLFWLAVALTWISGAIYLWPR
ncbi:CDP-diacylglycerol--glycerol-3-phosphate 3-phosphatidyltransferase [Gloeobacter kilaueensis]|uniref:CDP-diacylglycerol--glycerol-3-phosphate 3-phosphatidyltransferase n=1 Tax=Gloeobacter kilaueensis (strain ATCC BAA-2537 / CCAP 1431/1 / ULC 316 / JS1) TaxID=1183438 RepID=U5QDC8_GLOK1|nr:CDP-diacylglycerol--glycerol-3-phosphate 3-phosphatidyltransferase [Gloeobacter kilaueensis]AGY56932.1 CDP-diacylglycerol--glycerol-3-phosphate 3-phosphatidyltransferase [Gloeobacter kilaueensis JS1]